MGAIVRLLFHLVSDACDGHAVADASLGWRCHQLWYKWTQSQDGNGVADSLPSGSGNLDVQLGRQQLPIAHSLGTLELSERPVKGSFQVGFVTE